MAALTIRSRACLLRLLALVILTSSSSVSYSLELRLNRLFQQEQQPGQDAGQVTGQDAGQGTKPWWEVVAQAAEKAIPTAENETNGTTPSAGTAETQSNGTAETQNSTQTTEPNMGSDPGARFANAAAAIAAINTLDDPSEANASSTAGSLANTLTNTVTGTQPKLGCLITNSCTYKPGTKSAEFAKPKTAPGPTAAAAPGSNPNDLEHDARAPRAVAPAAARTHVPKHHVPKAPVPRPPAPKEVEAPPPPVTRPRDNFAGAQNGAQGGALGGVQNGAQTGTQTGAQAGTQTGSQTGEQGGAGAMADSAYPPVIDAFPNQGAPIPAPDSLPDLLMVPPTAPVLTKLPGWGAGSGSSLGGPQSGGAVLSSPRDFQACQACGSFPPMDQIVGGVCESNCTSGCCVHWWRVQTSASSGLIGSCSIGCNAAASQRLLSLGSSLAALLLALLLSWSI